MITRGTVCLRLWCLFGITVAGGIGVKHDKRVRRRTVGEVMAGNI